MAVTNQKKNPLLFLSNDLLVIWDVASVTVPHKKQPLHKNEHWQESSAGSSFSLALTYPKAFIINRPSEMGRSSKAECGDVYCLTFSSPHPQLCQLSSFFIPERVINFSKDWALQTTAGGHSLW